MEVAARVSEVIRRRFAGNNQSSYMLLQRVLSSSPPSKICGYSVNGPLSNTMHNVAVAAGTITNVVG